MTRDKLIETAENYARKLGWTDIVTEDNGATVEILMSAPGATEQIARASLAKLRKAIDEVGGPELYATVEEYDLEAAEYAAASEGGEVEEYPRDEVNGERELPEPCADLAEAEEADHADEPLEIEKPETLREHDPAAWESDGPVDLPEPEIEVTLPQEVIEAAMQDLESDLAPKEAPKPRRRNTVKKESRDDLVARCKELGITGYSGLNMKAMRVLIHNVERMQQGPIEDVSGDSLGGGVRDISAYVSPKEAASSGDDQDRGGIPDPTSLFKDEVLHAPEGYTLIARNGEAERDMCGDSIRSSVKAAWEKEGWNFFAVKKAARRAAAHSGDVVVNKATGHVTLVNGRAVAADGYKIKVAKGAAVQYCKTVNPDLWRSKGWQLSVVPA
jgi:hypothetical protein